LGLYSIQETSTCLNNVVVINPNQPHAQRIPHGKNEVNRAAVCPTNADLVATTSDCGRVFLFSLASQEKRRRLLQQARRRRRRDGGGGGGSIRAGGSSGGSSVGSSAPFRPDGVLDSGRSGGFGICWARTAPNQVLAARGGIGVDGLGGSGTGSGAVCVWDCGRTGEGLRPLEPVYVIPDGHRGAANDVTCHPNAAGVFATAGDDSTVRLHDARVPFYSSSSSGGGGSSGVLLFQSEHGETLDCLDWEPTEGHLIAAGGGDGRLYVIDARMAAAGAVADAVATGGSSQDAAAAAAGGEGRGPRPAVIERRQHAAGVAQVEWSTTARGVLATCSEDGFVVVWDVAQATAAVAVEGSAAVPSRPAAAAADADAAPAGRRARKSAAPHRLGGGGGAAAAAAAPADPLRQHLRSAGGGSEGAARGLLFLHVGHSSCQGVAWNPDCPWVVASVGRALVDSEEGGAGLEAPVVQVWRPLGIR
jgi:hypothetical protein